MVKQIQFFVLFLLSIALSLLLFYSANCQLDVSQKQANFFTFAHQIIPHPDKKKIGRYGEDAQYSNQNVLVVADGIGEWASGEDMEIEYSYELCHHMENLFTNLPQYYTEYPKQLIVDSHNNTKAIGGTTVCVMTLDQDTLFLRTAHVGNSGYALYRMQDAGYEMIHKSQDQKKSKDFPYHVIDKIILKIGSEGDDPQCAIIDIHWVNPFDLVIMGSDGLFDNIGPNAMKTILDEYHFSNTDFDLQKLAKKIAYYAYRLSMDQSELFLVDNHHWGGKSDDITVMVALINQGGKLIEN